MSSDLSFMSKMRKYNEAIHMYPLQEAADRGFLFHNNGFGVGSLE